MRSKTYKTAQHAWHLTRDLWSSTVHRSINQTLITVAYMNCIRKKLFNFSFTHPLPYYLHEQKETTFSQLPYRRTTTAHNQSIRYFPHSSISAPSSWTIIFFCPVSSTLEGLSVLSECWGIYMYPVIITSSMLVKWGKKNNSNVVVVVRLYQKAQQFMEKGKV